MKYRVKLFGLICIVFVSGFFIGYLVTYRLNITSAGYYTFEQAIDGKIWVPKWESGVWDVYADEKHPAEIEFEFESLEKGKIILIIGDLLTEHAFFNNSAIGYIEYTFRVEYSIKLAIMWFLLFDEMFYYREGSPVYVYTRITQWTALPHNLP